MKRHLALLAFFVLVAAAWSWPAPLLDPQRLPQRHFDLLPVLWLLEAAPDVGIELVFADSSWPQGETLARLDSWVLLVLGWALRPLLKATTIALLLAWLGPALSAFAAERAAAVLGARRPWTVVAGLAYGFSGVAASAALEGHLPHLLEPWLPLVLAAGWRAGDADGRPVHGLLAGVGAALALLTTAYHGLAAALLLSMLALRAGRRLPRLLPALLVLGPVAGWLAWAFSLGGGDQVAPRRVIELASLGSASLSSLFAWSPTQDLLHHSVGAPTGGLVIAALCLGWRDRQDRWLLGLALLSSLLALGPVLRLSVDDAGWASPLAGLWHSPAGALLRFPVRFAWLTALCGGVAVARLLTRVAPRLPRPAAAALLTLALVDAFLTTGMPGRQAEQPLLAAAGEPEGAVLDLFPVAAWPAQSDIEMRARTTACARQLSHQRATLARCIGTSVSDPRTTVSTWLLPRLLQAQGPPRDTSRRLAALGVGSVVLHAAAFRPEDLPPLRAGLERALGAPVHDAGGLVAFAVPSPTEDRAAAALALARLR